MLETNNTSAYEINYYNELRVSSVNRTFVEMISNIHYFESSETVINIFKQIFNNYKQNELKIDTIYKVIEKFEYKSIFRNNEHRYFRAAPQATNLPDDRPY